MLHQFYLLFDLVQLFKVKLTLSKEHPGKSEQHHFTQMQELMAEIKMQDLTKFRRQVSLLKQWFEERFTYFQDYVKYVQLITNPFLNFIYRSCYFFLSSSPSSGIFKVGKSHSIAWKI
jgi:hypothetical protein